MTNTAVAQNNFSGWPPAPGARRSAYGNGISMGIDECRSVVLNKIGKAEKVIVEYAHESPSDYGRTADAIAQSLAQWTARRDELVATYNALARV